MPGRPILPTPPGHDNCPGGEDMDRAQRARGVRRSVRAPLARASSQAVHANVFQPQGQRAEQPSQPGPQRWRTIAPSSLTPEPIPQQSLHLAPRSVAQEIPLLTPLTLEPTSTIGVYGWGPPSGPAGCKFFILLKHVSRLAVTFLGSRESQLAVRFWIDFGGVKVPCVSHRFYFENEPHSEFGVNREVLLALVPYSPRQEVNMSLYVDTNRGCMESKLPLGRFKYDDEVPLKRYGRPRDLIVFLQRGRPEDDDVRVPKNYLASELTEELFPHHGSLPQPSYLPRAIPSDTPKKRSKSKKKENKSKPAPSSTSTPNSAIPSTPTSKAGQESSPVSKKQKSSTTPRQVRRRYLRLQFADPRPSALGWSSSTPWTPREIAAKRRLVAISCISNHVSNHFDRSATFYSAAVPTAEDCPPDSKLISCIYVSGCPDLGDTCVITSADFLSLWGWMLGNPEDFDIAERDRIRRNIEIFRPVTIYKSKHTGSMWELYSQIIAYRNPRPLNIPRDFKVFRWDNLEIMMRRMANSYGIVGEEMESSDKDPFEVELESAKADLFREIGQRDHISEGKEQTDFTQCENLNSMDQVILGQAVGEPSLDKTIFGGHGNVGEVDSNSGFLAGDLLNAGSLHMSMSMGQPWYSQSLGSSPVSQVAAGLDGVFQDWAPINNETSNPSVFGGHGNIGEVHSHSGFLAGDLLNAGSLHMSMSMGQPWHSQPLEPSPVSQVAAGLDALFQDLAPINNTSAFANSSVNQETSINQNLYLFTNQEFGGGETNEAQLNHFGAQQQLAPLDILNRMALERTDAGVTTQQAQPGHLHQLEQEDGADLIPETPTLWDIDYFLNEDFLMKELADRESRD